MKKYLLLLLVALLPILANAYDVCIDGIYYNFSGTNATVTFKNTNYNSYSGVIVIPTSITYRGKTYSVTSIGEDAFMACSNLTSINIGNSVIGIGDRAFRDCSSLTSITIPESVTGIGSFSFSYCDNLVSITIPNGVTSIGECALYGCSGLTSVTIPKSVTSIGSYAFWGCNNLAMVTIESNFLVSVPHTSTTSMKSLFGNQVETYIIADNVNTIGDYAFCDCSGLTSITIPESVTNISPNAFYGCI